MREVTESIICDSCKKELVCNTAYPAVYALELHGINVNRNTSGTQFAVIVSKPETQHFCNVSCLLTFWKRDHHAP